MATYVWNTLAGGNWGTLSNWRVGGSQPASLPGLSDDVQILLNITTSPTTVVAQSVIYAKSISIGDTSPVNAQWSLGSAAQGTSNALVWEIPSTGGTINVPNTGSDPYGLSRSTVWLNIGNTSAGSLTKTGPGTLSILQGFANNFSGDFLLNEGVLVTGVGGPNATPSGMGGGTTRMANGTILLGFGNSETTYPSNIAINSGASATIMSRHNGTNSGGFLVNGNIDVPVGSTLIFNNQNTKAISTSGGGGIISGGGTIDRVAATNGYLLALYDDNTFYGTFKNSAGNVTLYSAFALQNAILQQGTTAASTLTMGSAYADFYLGGLTGSENFVYATNTITNLWLGGATISPGDASWSGNFATNINIYKIGSGTQTLAGINSARTSATTSINYGSLQLNQSNALYSGAATGTTTVLAGAEIKFSGNITTPGNTQLTLGGTIRSVSGAPSYGATVTLSGDASFTADSGTSLNIFGLNLNSAIATISGLGTVKWNNAPTNGSLSKTLIFGRLDLSAISATLFRVYGTGTLTGSINIASGGDLIGGNYAAGQTLTISGSVTTSGGINLISGGVTGGVASKVAVSGALNSGGTSMTVKGFGTNWQTNTEYAVATYGSGTPSVNSSAGSWSSSTNSRVGNGTVRVDSVNKQILLTPAVLSNISSTWNGGSAGVWYAGQPSGWISSSASQSFENSDTVTFSGAQSTTTATLSGSVTVVSLSILNTTNVARSQIITGSTTITNIGALSVTNSGTSTQDFYLYTPATHGSISISNGTSGSGTTLHIDSTSSIQGPSTISFNNATLRYTGAVATLTKNFTLTNNATLDASGAGLLTWSGTPAIASGTKTLTFIGTTSGSVSSTLTDSTGVLAVTKSGSGIWTLSSANTHSGANTISSGKLIVSKKTGLGTGSVSLAASLQFTDTVTDTAKIASVSSFTTSGVSARLIIGA